MERMSFYAAFEARYRGSREDIKRRLWVYGPFLDDLKATSEGRPLALDLGCGRGEWLEILREAGLDGQGVDTDPDMARDAVALGLAVRQQDALAALRACADESLDLVTAFQVVEHLGFTDVKAVVAECLRVLRPGGLMILETPNPENLSVGAHSFYLDPTHVRPLPPRLLSFVPEHLGFHRTKVMRLQEPPELGGNHFPSLGSILTEVSPDYAVVAQKAGPAAGIARFDTSFGRHYGVSLEDLTQRHDFQRERLDEQLQARLAAAESAVAESNVLAREAQAQAAEAQRLATEAQARATAAEGSIRPMVDSASWRITAPLRALADRVKRLRGR
jgi:SAM-dependent methyltransferase